MKRVGLYGGSFDPIHNGHVEPVIAAAAQLDLERVLYLPTAQPPHKPGGRFAPPLRRFAMVELALLDRPTFVVSDLELGGEPSYTVDTIERFRRDHPEAEPYLLIGSDSLAQIESWRRWEEILALASIGVLRRPGWTRRRVEKTLSDAGRERLESTRVSWIDHPPLEISATEIRRLLGRGEPIPPAWLPEPVLEYVRKYSLYS